jgi:hypothetical protein
VTLPINEEAYSKSAGLVGTVLMSLVYAATFSFADVPEHKRPGFSLIVDEFQNFATEDYAKLFSQGRKFRVKQFLAHQYRGQLSDTPSDANRDATLSAFTKVIFQVTEPNSWALSWLFVDLEERCQPANLAIDILDKLERHPNPVVNSSAQSTSGRCRRAREIGSAREDGSPGDKEVSGGRYLSLFGLSQWLIAACGQHLAAPMRQDTEQYHLMKGATIR